MSPKWVASQFSRAAPTLSFNMDRILFGLTATALLAAPLGAQETIASDRPGIGSGATVIDRGVVQLETGANLNRIGGDNVFSVGEALLRIGVPGFELEVFGNSWVSDGALRDDIGLDDDGFQDLALGAKVPLTSNENITLAAQAYLVTPTGSDAFTADEWIPGGALLADLPLGEGTALSLNAGYRAGPGDVEDVFSLIVTPALAFENGLGVYGGYAGSYSEGAAHIAEAGLTWLASSDLQLDLNGGWEVGVENWFVGLGLAVRTR